MSTRVCIVGTTGYAGAELAAQLARHGGVSLVGLFSGPGGATVPFAAVHPALRGRSGPEVVPLDRPRLAAAEPELVFLATPTEVSLELVPELLARGIKVIDLSGAFRLRDRAAFERWYGLPHSAPALLAQAAYGLSEWWPPARGTALVANPGCYPTATLLGLLPLRDVLEGPIVCDAKSGASGAGRTRNPAHSFAELDGDVRAYSLGGHRHEPEMRQGLGLEADAPFTFVPHLLPVVRGLMATIHVGFRAPMTTSDVAALFAARYADDPVVGVRSAGEAPALRDVVGTPRAEIGFAVAPGGRRAVIVSVIDNLLKGAASQAVQNMNHVLGFAPIEGLA